MGYCYDDGGKLCCDACGDSGQVRKRTCPYRVHYAEGGSLPYCSPSALCAACYHTHKATLHADCKAGAAKRTAEELERAAMLEAGQYERRTAWGDWHPFVPAGFVGLRFVNKAGKELYRLISTERYESITGQWLRDYPWAQEWPKGAEA
jgi:hypothetical protein